MNFSQRIGLEPAVRPFQRNSMDIALRTGLWNSFELTFIRTLRNRWHISRHSQVGVNSTLFVALWIGFYKWPLSTLPLEAPEALDLVRRWFFDESKMPWNRIYEFIEFVANREGELKSSADSLKTCSNIVLETEFSAYRFVGNTLAPITNQAEIEAIVQAASADSSVLQLVSKHIDTALQLLSDKTAPDYRNSMKESISAVEAICKIIAPNTKTLGPALDNVTARVNLHPKLQEGFKALYSYTSDTHGIRHALKDDATPEPEDATFMLVTCSAFVNYLTEKARKNGLLTK